MKKYSFCPQCQIGLNSQEMQLGFWQNCKHSWEDEDDFEEESVGRENPTSESLQRNNGSTSGNTGQIRPIIEENQNLENH